MKKIKQRAKRRTKQIKHIQVQQPWWQTARGVTEYIYDRIAKLRALIRQTNQQ